VATRQTLILSKRDIEGLLTYEAAIERVEYVFREWGRGNIVMPAKITLDMSRSGYDSWANAMPAFVVPTKAAGVKWIGGYADNARHNLPFIMGAILLSDPQTGCVLAVMDGSHITNFRTGASAMICAKYLASSKATRLAIVGGGMQGYTSLKAMSAHFKKILVKVAEISAGRRRQFCETARIETGLNVSEVETIEEAVSDADIIVLVTTAKQPIVKDKWIKAGSIVLAMGSFQQVEDEFALSANKIVVDSLEQASHRGEIKHLVETGQITKNGIYAELGDIVAGKKKGRETDQERILMIPVGLGAHDICIAHHLYQLAVEKDIGVWVDLL
jgi:alanine dehydrogenase